MSSPSSTSRTTSRPPPRPCLKHTLTAKSSPHPSRPQHSQSPVDVSSPPLHAHSHVHFPPSPALSTTFPTHSKKTYDRRPLVVAPNACALPARGCPGRTYAPGAYRQLESDTAGSDVYADIDVNLDDLLFSSRTPSANAMPTTPAPRHLSLPALIPDHGISSSESDESDILQSPRGPIGMRYGGDTHVGERQMEFLPHPSREKDREREREREKEIRRRRRRERAEEEGRWKMNGLMPPTDGGSCLGGF